MSTEQVTTAEGTPKANMTAWTRSLRHLEWSLLLIGAILLTSYVVARIHTQISARLALGRFKAAQVRLKTSDSDQSPGSGDVDFSLWSEKRVRGYNESLVTKTDSPLAVLLVPKLRLEVPVFEGTDELTLNRGVGRIVGTAKSGQTGNMGIAGHRDGFFRGLKDVGVGDRMDLVTSNRTHTYVVDKVQIVDPDNVSVLQPTPNPSLTLVTCYPFYFIGSAPQRYIVHASITNVESTEQQPN